MRINRQIRVPNVRLIGADGNQVGIVSTSEALDMATSAGLDLVEISPNAEPPVCKIMDYGKFRYDQTKRDKENKKAQVLIKVKEVKVKPNIDSHDLELKIKKAKEFLSKGFKVKLTCMFRGREMAHPEIGRRVVEKFCEDVAEYGAPEAPLKLLGRNLTTVLAPQARKK